MDILGTRIKKARVNMGITQEELAEKIGVARATVASWEIGRRDPDTDVLNKISKICKVSIDWLLDNDEQFHNPPNEVDQLVEHLHKRPELKMLFSKTKNATKEDIEKAASYIEFLKKQSEGDFDE